MFVNYAHRGASSYTPENTMSAFRKALELRATGIELDLQKTKDRKIVIFHDSTIDKKSNNKGKISDYTYNELKEMDFGSWFGKEYKNERIVLFEDFAKEFLNKDLTFAIELKVVGIEKETLDIINKYKTHDNIYITSFIYEALENIRKIDNDIKISWLIKEKINEDNINKLLKIKGNQICPAADIVTEDDIKLAKTNGIYVRLWGVNSEDIMKKVYSLDIEGMTVNFPDKLNELLRNRIYSESKDLNEKKFSDWIDTVIYKTDNFVVTVPKEPHIPREDGGHLLIRGKDYYESRTDFTPKLATEVMRLSILIGEAMKKGMKNRGIDIERINYQENGNWAYQKGRKPVFHIHLYGRTKNSVTQTWSEALFFPNKSTGFYDKFEPFTKEDIEEIKKQISMLENNEKYNTVNWNLRKEESV